ncbi:Flp family type IVb pilin [Jannaschia seohaensis]|uniref:Uncharacterized protein n=1 Tax=Jannaschia seohaensis TaxID=475081 RepID=A0A2Y9B042_9RHOB|nr:hypothetical protein [Jannaschia seohaensis]PWJ15025.1 hypothetical protein BCF38_11142 [Jannaschia seohaensis]SSA49874.1 hypothetical protein SAMN05421539_11142 [Jannaschia seohaensis]
MLIKNFLKDESGAVTVDWVVLTAALVGLGLAVMAVISSGLENLSGDIETQMSDGSIIRTAFVGSIADARDAACTGIVYCDDTLSAAALADLGSTDMAAIANVDYGSQYLTDSGLTFGGADGTTLGTAGTDTDGNPTFTAADQTTIDEYNAVVAASDAQNALIDAEKAARAN